MFTVFIATHAAPTETEMTASATHVGAPTIFLNHHTASGTPSHVLNQREALEGTLLLVVTLATFVPRLLTLEAGEVAAVRTL